MVQRPLRIPVPLAVLLAALSLLAFAAPALGAAGEPDSTFGNQGFTILDEPEAEGEFLEDVVVLPDGKILGAGGRGEPAGFLLARFNADGTPDESFGTGGIRVEPDKNEPGSPLEINAIKLRADGKIVAAGLGLDSKKHGAFEFARYRPDGTLDPEFGTGGLATVPVEPSGQAFAVDEAPDGRVVAAGGAGLGTKAIVVRLRENGLPDTDFSAVPAGVRTVDVPGSKEELAESVRVLASGTVLIGGFAETGGFLAELDSNGNPVNGFGENGIAVDDLGTAGEPSGEIEDLRVLPDGSILATGAALAPGTNDFQLFVARFTPTGALDPSFGEGGVFHLNPTPGDDEGFALSVLPDGRILVAGVRGESAALNLNRHTWLVRLTPEGQLDPTFGNGGETTVSGVAEFDEAGGLALQPDGKAVIAGDAFDGGSRKLLVGRFTADPPPSPPTARCGKRTATIVGTTGADRLKGTKRADVIAALGGNDHISSGGGNDVVCAGAGKDVVSAGKGNDQVRGEAGADTLRGGPGKDLLLGGAGADRLFGGPGSQDRCNGGAGKHDAGGQGCEQLRKLP